MGNESFQRMVQSCWEGSSSNEGGGGTSVLLAGTGQRVFSCMLPL